MRVTPTCVALFWFVARIPCLGQANSTFRNITVDDGLSENYVASIYQDHRGYMWFGTRGGLNRYDGYDLREYAHDPRNNSSLSSSYITSILQPTSLDGLLLVGTDIGGLNLMNVQTGHCERFLSDSIRSTTLGSSEIIFLFEDSRKSIWVGTSHGVNQFHPETRTFTRYPFGSHQSPCDGEDYFRAASEDNNGILWFATQYGLRKLVPGSSVLKRVLPAPFDTRPMGENHLVSISAISEKPGKFWTVTVTGTVLIFNAKSEQFEHYGQVPFPKGDKFGVGRVTSMYADGEAMLWFGLYDGTVITLDAASRKWNHIVLEPHRMIQILTILKDRTGLFWIGSGGGGISVVQQEGVHFSLYKHSRSPGFSPGDDAVWSLHQTPDNRIWVGTGNALCILDEKKSEFF